MLIRTALRRHGIGPVVVFATAMRDTFARFGGKVFGARREGKNRIALPMPAPA